MPGGDKGTKRPSAKPDGEPPAKRRADGSSSPPATSAPAKKQQAERAVASKKRKDELTLQYRRLLIEAIASKQGWPAVQAVFDRALATVTSGKETDNIPTLPYLLYAEYIELAPEAELHNVLDWIEKPEVAKLFQSAKNKTHFLTELYSVNKTLSNRVWMDPGLCGRAKMVLARLCPLPFDVGMIRRTAPAPNKSLAFAAAPAVEQTEDASGLSSLYAELKERYSISATTPEKLLQHVRHLSRLASGTSAAEMGRTARKVLSVCTEILDLAKQTRQSESKPHALSAAAEAQKAAGARTIGSALHHPGLQCGQVGAPALLHDTGSRFLLLAEVAQVLGVLALHMFTQLQADNTSTPEVKIVCERLRDAWNAMERERPGSAAAAKAEFFREGTWSHWKRSLHGSNRVFEGAAAAHELAVAASGGQRPKGMPAAAYPQRIGKNVVALTAPTRWGGPPGTDAGFPHGLRVLRKEKERTLPRSGVWDNTDAVGWGAWWGHASAPDGNWLADAQPEEPEWLSAPPPAPAPLAAGSVELWRKVRGLTASHLSAVHTIDDVKQVRWRPILDPRVVARVEGSEVAAAPAEDDAAAA
eukprot:TRINITY_DN28892_c0_g1_i1.p1 TRINITY_DN28892_c0_g1~~TRINITY_DN28892_c0_g1_i1.p1  ORF type:complete len:587 (+),score=236.69 TRINITY_DN28892_c0_g1_i1:58-1818(+)